MQGGARQGLQVCVCAATTTTTTIQLPLKNKLRITSVVSPTAATLCFYKSIWSVLRSQALEPSPEPCWTWPGCTKAFQTFAEPSPEPCWTWPGCTKASRTFSGTFSGTLLSGLAAPKPPRPSPEPSPEPCWTWPGCTKASRTFSGTFSRTLLNLTWLHQSLQDLHRNLLRNPVEPGLALPQSFPNLLRNLLQNPVELSNLIGSAPKPPAPSPEPSSEFCWTWPGSATKPPRPSPEPSPEPCWTWPALHQSLPDLLRNLLQNPVEFDLALHQSLPDLHRNLLRNPVEPDLALHQSFPDLLRNPLELDRLCTKASQILSGTFFGTLLNLTWLCTKTSQTFTGTFSGTLLNLTRLCTKASQTFSGTLLNLTLHQSLPDLVLTLLPPEPCWTWLGSAPKPPGSWDSESGKLQNQDQRHQNLLRNPVRTWPGSAPKLPRPSPEPSPEPCWTWPALHQSLPDLHRNLRNFSGTSLNLTRRLHQCTPELFWAEDPISLRCWGKIYTNSWHDIFGPTAKLRSAWPSWAPSFTHW